MSAETLAALARLESENERLRAVLRDLVTLKDGPRDETYRQSKDAAWEKARHELAKAAEIRTREEAPRRSNG